MNQPLIDLETAIFNRGEHEGELLDDVAKDDPEYLERLVSECDTDLDSIGLVQDYISEHPDQFEE